jgi:hypothetical protein
MAQKITVLPWSTYNGTSWVPYTANSFVQIPAGGTTLLVRTAIINDIPSDNGQTFTLTATNTGTTAATGTATIKDDGTGDVYSGTSGTPTANVPAESLNDDRPLAVNDVTVNEGSSLRRLYRHWSDGSICQISLS